MKYHRETKLTRKIKNKNPNSLIRNLEHNIRRENKKENFIYEKENINI